VQAERKNKKKSLFCFFRGEAYVKPKVKGSAIRAKNKNKPYIAFRRRSPSSIGKNMKKTSQTKPIFLQRKGISLQLN